MRGRLLRKLIALVIFLLLVFAAGAIGSVVTLSKIPTWYAALQKPWFNPPPGVFGPVWTLLYILMAVAAWRVWQNPASPERHRALVGWGVQLVLNAVWSPVFFGLEQPLFALAVIVALLITLAATVMRFLSVDRLSGWMLMPYLAWVAFASVLNGAIVVLN
jgi:translocator protein